MTRYHTFTPLLLVPTANCGGGRFKLADLGLARFVGDPFLIKVCRGLLPLPPLGLPGFGALRIRSTSFAKGRPAIPLFTFGEGGLGGGAISISASLNLIGAVEVHLFLVFVVVTVILLGLKKAVPILSC